MDFRRKLHFPETFSWTMSDPTGQCPAPADNVRLTILSKQFYDTSTGAATGAARYEFLWRRSLASWSLAMDEYSGYKYLRGSSRRSVKSYVHGRTELYCSDLTCLSPFFFF
jgi:hypothetical protein